MAETAAANATALTYVLITISATAIVNARIMAMIIVIFTVCKADWGLNDILPMPCG